MRYLLLVSALAIITVFIYGSTSSKLSIPQYEVLTGSSMVLPPIITNISNTQLKEKDMQGSNFICTEQLTEQAISEFFKVNPQGVEHLPQCYMKHGYCSSPGSKDCETCQCTLWYTNNPINLDVR